MTRGERLFRAGDARRVRPRRPLLFILLFPTLLPVVLGLVIVWMEQG